MGDWLGRRFWSDVAGSRQIARGKATRARPSIDRHESNLERCADRVGGVSPTARQKPPTSAEAERIASDMAIDNRLQKGDSVSTDRGFFVYRGIGADGYTNEFMLVANPLTKLK
jgi:hypothetical protein